MKTVKLSKPVEHNGTTYTEFTFREAEVGDLMLADAVKGEMSKIIAVLASMADVPLPAFRKVKSRDLNVIMAATKDLLGEEPPVTTGG
ncbi:phage tail assembly protein [Shinella zoogloeoides]